MSAKKLLCMSFAVSLLVALAMANKVAATDPTIFVDPPMVTHELGDTFDIDVNLRDVEASSRLIGLEFRLTYCPDLLEVVDVTEGPFLQDPEWNLYGTWWAFFIEDDGVYGPHVLFGTILFPNPVTELWEAFPYGGGTVATITFRCLGQGECTLGLLDTLLVSDEIEEISHATEDGYVIQWGLEATVDMDPDTLNTKSEGKWITSYIELPEGYDVSGVDIATVMLNGVVSARLHPTGIGDYDDDGIPDLMVKFNRQDVIALLSAGEATLTITGQLVDGTPFEGSDTIRVIGE